MELNREVEYAKGIEVVNQLLGGSVSMGMLLDLLPKADLAHVIIYDELRLLCSNYLAMWNTNALFVFFGTQAEAKSAASLFLLWHQLNCDS